MAWTPAPPEQSEVGVIITTRDSWSLSIEGKLSKAGNKLLWEVGVDEANFLGLGKSVGFGYSRDIDRDSLRFGFHDPQLFGTSHELRGEYRDQSDGSSFRLTKMEPSPFGGVKGVHFEFTRIRKVDNVVLSGEGWAAVSKGELFAMLYMAPRLGFFPRHAAQVQKIAMSAKIRE